MNQRMRMRYMGGVVVCAAFYLLIAEPRTLAAPVAAPTVMVYPNCDDVCTRDTECTTQCMSVGGEQFQITCDQFTAGECSNTCEVTCDAGTSGETECTASGGEETTCEGYGVYLHCGGDACAGGESCGSCSDDCGVCPSTTDQEDLTAIAITARAITAATGSLGEYDSSKTACSIAASTYWVGWVNPWDCPTFDQMTFLPAPMCDAKNAYLASILDAIDFDQALIENLLWCVATSEDEDGCIDCAALAAQWEDVLAGDTALRDAVKATPCYMFNF
jgi:hypothetical protein